MQSPYAVPAGQTFMQTEQAIHAALARRQWQVEMAEPGRVVAHIDVRRHRLRADVRYDAQQVSVYYADSVNLKARVGSDGLLYAHHKVNEWLHNLALDIAATLAVTAPAESSGGSAPPSPAGPAPGQPVQVPGAPAPTGPLTSTP